MFGLSKSERIKKLYEEASEIKKQALHFYNFKEEVEEKAFSELCNLSFKKGLPPSTVARSPEGVNILSEVALNRQYALYLNEKAIQLYAEIFKIQHGRATNNKEEWLEQIVKKAGWDVVSAEIPSICSSLICDADKHVSEIS
ncbi:hypothetical protein RGI85_001935 [Serratia marcescens]